MSAPKQIIILRKDLNMRKGKMVAQGAHASMAVIVNLLEPQSIYNEPNGSDFDGLAEHGLFLSSDNLGYSKLKLWLDGKFTKICVSVNSEDELVKLYDDAKAQGILCSLIQDAGLTEFGGVKTYTAVAIGPDFPEVIDPLTKHLPLL
jgi:PTH2 family peptidyl-tRNA hydrolase